MKRIVSFALAMVMILAMGVTVGAADNYSITIENKDTSRSIVGKKYDIYKIFGVTYPGYSVDPYSPTEEKYAYTIAPGFENFTFYYPAPTPTTPATEETTFTGQKLVDVLSKLKGNDAELQRFAREVLTYATSPATKVDPVKKDQEADAEVFEIGLNTPGYYLVHDTGTTGTEPIVSACILTTTKPAATVNPKVVNPPTIDKDIRWADSTGLQDYGKGASAYVGEDKEFRLTSKIPNMNGYTSYTYNIIDILSPGLTFVNSDNPNDLKEDVSVVIDDMDIHRDQYEVTLSEVIDENGQNTGESKLEIKFLNFIQYREKEGQKITVTYYAKLNEKAITRDEENNLVKIEYSNNPNNEEDKEKTPEKKTYIYDFDINIIKFTIDAETTTERKLNGAKFVLKQHANDFYYKVDEETKEVTWVNLDDFYPINGVDIKTPEDQLERAIEKKTITEVETQRFGQVDGTARFTGLSASTWYELVETKAPDGYNKLNGDYAVLIVQEFDQEGRMTGYIVEYVHGDEYSEVNNTFVAGGQPTVDFKVENKSGSELPETGGVGTTLFYVFGGLLVLAAAGMLIAKKRTPEANQE